MCQYSCEKHDGIVNAWHLVHLVSRSYGTGLVITEASAIEPNGRISLRDAGIWNDQHIEAWKPITQAIKETGAVSCIQIAHAGRKVGLEHTPLKS